MIGDRLAEPKAGTISQREFITKQRVSTLPLDALEVTHQQHPNACTQGDRRLALASCAVGHTTLFREAIEPRFVWDAIQPFLERMSWREG
jgi:hypothetical protein